MRRPRPRSREAGFSFVEILVVMGIIYLRTNDPKWRQLLFFWVKVYGLVFALGVKF